MRLKFMLVLLASIVTWGCNAGPANVNTNGNSNGNANVNAALSFKTPAPIRPNDAVDPGFKACNVYFPLVPGSIAKYAIHYPTGIVADLTIVIDATDENGRKVFTQRSQLVDSSGGMQIVQTITRRFACEGEKVIILSEKTESNVKGQQSSADFEFRENSLMMTDSKSMSTKGSTWTHAFRPTYHTPGSPPARSDKPTIISFEVGVAKHVTIPIGTFKAVPVTRKVEENLTVDYYVAGLGLVKRQFEGSSWELKEYSGLRPQD